MSAVSSFIVASLRYVAPRPFQTGLSLAGRGGRAQSMGRCRGVSVGCHGICGGCGKYGVISKKYWKGAGFAVSEDRGGMVFAAMRAV